MTLSRHDMHTHTHACARAHTHTHQHTRIRTHTLTRTDTHAEYTSTSTQYHTTSTHHHTHTHKHTHASAHTHTHKIHCNIIRCCVQRTIRPWCCVQYPITHLAIAIQCMPHTDRYSRAQFLEHTATYTATHLNIR